MENEIARYIKDRLPVGRGISFPWTYVPQQRCFRFINEILIMAEIPTWQPLALIIPKDNWTHTKVVFTDPRHEHLIHIIDDELKHRLGAVVEKAAKDLKQFLRQSS